jgi:hypothetical protein
MAPTCECAKYYASDVASIDVLLKDVDPIYHVSPTKEIISEPIEEIVLVKEEPVLVKEEAIISEPVLVKEDTLIKEAISEPVLAVEEPVLVKEDTLIKEAISEPVLVKEAPVLLEASKETTLTKAVLVEEESLKAIMRR